MIISISGKKGSGKSTLSLELINNGFIKISFADFLKEVCAKLYDFPHEWTLSQEHKEMILEIPYVWNEEKCKELSLLIDEEIKFDGVEVEFYTIRHMLQYIGTEVLRKHDSDFHVKKTIERIDNKKNYCLDDTRFENELKILKSSPYTLAIRVNRSSLKSVDEHVSEKALDNYKDWDYVIENNGTLEDLRIKAKEIVDRLKL